MDKNVYDINVKPLVHKFEKWSSVDEALLNSNGHQTRKDSNIARRSDVKKSQMEEFREAFRLIDRDDDGKITKEELKVFMKGLGQFATKAELQTMIEEIDFDGDSNISLKEFVAITGNMETTEGESSEAEKDKQELQDAFRVFDKRNRGYITGSDLRVILKCLGEDLSEKEVDDMIEEVDVNGDGRIDFNVFVRAIGEP